LNSSGTHPDVDEGARETACSLFAVRRSVVPQSRIGKRLMIIVPVLVLHAGLAVRVCRIGSRGDAR